MAQQLPWALLFFAVGGLTWVVWGICARVAASVTGHWLVGYFAHNRGPRSWHVEGAGVQGYNVPYCGRITMGEAWHNNHHAFPSSARLGLRDDEVDPGWWVLRALPRSAWSGASRRPRCCPTVPIWLRSGGDGPCTGAFGQGVNGTRWRTNIAPVYIHGLRV